MSQDQDQNIDTQGEANGMPISYSYETLPVTLESEMKRSYLDYAMSAEVADIIAAAGAVSANA